MDRNVNIEEISDGKKYRVSDMVKIGCNECEGCSKCCQHMEGLITLDPYDIYRIISGFKDKSFQDFIDVNIAFIVDKGITTPVLKMNAKGCCTFLNENGRCSIHNIRPGICRLFPMGRLYEDGGFYYFLQKNECDYPGKTKVKLKNWLDTPEIAKYEKFICDWHYLIKSIQEYMQNASEEEIKQINAVLLRIFYLTPYSDGFYDEFYTRLNKVKALIE